MRASCLAALLYSSDFKCRTDATVQSIVVLGMTKGYKIRNPIIAFMYVMSWRNRVIVGEEEKAGQFDRKNALN